MGPPSRALGPTIRVQKSCLTKAAEWASILSLFFVLAGGTYVAVSLDRLQKLEERLEEVWGDWEEQRWSRDAFRVALELMYEDKLDEAEVVLLELKERDPDFIQGTSVNAGSLLIAIKDFRKVEDAPTRKRKIKQYIRAQELFHIVSPRRWIDLLPEDSPLFRNLPGPGRWRPSAPL